MRADGDVAVGKAESVRGPELVEEPRDHPEEGLQTGR